MMIYLEVETGVLDNIKDLYCNPKNLYAQGNQFVSEIFMKEKKN